MKCNKCNQIIPDDSRFCHLCGNKIPEESTYAEPNKPKKDKKPMSKKTRKAIMLTIISILSLAIIAILVFLFVIPMVKYNHAQELLEKGKYDLAYSAFAELADYSDSQDKLIETRYLQAVDYRKAGEYDVANSIFESLGNYRDSKVLIHIHDYTVSDSVAPTCTSKGSETIICLSCNNSKTSILEAIAHNYVLVKQTKATCDSAGEEIFSCSVCSHSYTNKIAQKTHSWTNATCTTPKTCSACGTTEGNALGHSNDVVCKQCGTTVFVAKEYSGRGPSSITDINLPKGKYNFILTHSGSSNFIANGTGGIWVNEIGNTSYVCQINCNDGMKSGFINISKADGHWTVKIEAIGN